MSTKENAVSTVEATETIPYVELAQARLQELRTTREQIPRLVIPQSSKDRARLVSAANVPPEFVELTVVAVANHKSLVREEGATPAEMRDLVSYADAFGPYADELEAFAQFVRYSVDAARHAVGSEALAIYAIAQRLAKLPKTAALAPHVADMKRALGRGRKKSAEAVAKKAAARAAKAAEKAEQAAAKVAKPAAK